MWRVSGRAVTSRAGRRGTREEILEFVSAAGQMRRAFGRPDHPFAVIEHPISGASRRVIEQRTEAALEQGLHFIVRG